MYTYLKEHNEEILFVDMCGNLLIVQCKDKIKCIFECPSVEHAREKLPSFRKDLEGVSNLRIDKESNKEE